jgi:hypothetical protein
LPKRFVFMDRFGLAIARQFFNGEL